MTIISELFNLKLYVLIAYRPSARRGYAVDVVNIYLDPTTAQRDLYKLTHQGYYAEIKAKVIKEG